jgi:hypothetical protein
MRDLGSRTGITPLDGQKGLLEEAVDLYRKGQQWSPLIVLRYAPPFRFASQAAAPRLVAVSGSQRKRKVTCDFTDTIAYLRGTTEREMALIKTSERSDSTAIACQPIEITRAVKNPTR